MAAVAVMLQAALAATAAAVLVLAGGWLRLLLSFLWRARDAVAAERRLLAEPLPEEAALPPVLVQLPVYNEGALAARAVAGAVALDWPRDRLHVQLLDDSTDGTPELAAAAVASACAAGFDVVHLRRGTRAGFKAGNLAFGLAASDHPFVAILDAEETAPPDFLRRAMRPLLRDARVGFVQTRRDFYNADETWLTRAQALAMDAHHCVEQPARAWTGQGMGFDGSCGIWRRAAIEAAGGWSGDSLTEDLDLAYRAYLLGWRPVMLTEVAVRSELPARYGDWRRQQRRWSAGHAQTARRLLPLVWRCTLPLRRKVESTLHLGSAALGALIALELALILAARLAGIAVPAWIAGLVAASAAVGLAVGIGLPVAARRALGRPLDARFWAAWPARAFLQPYAIVRHAADSWIAARFRPAVFERTPKTGR